MLIVEPGRGWPVSWSPSFVSRETFQQASDWQSHDCDRYSCFPHKVQETNTVSVAPDGCHLWFFMKCLNDYWMSWGIRFNNYDDSLKSSRRAKPLCFFFLFTRSNPKRSLIASIFILYALLCPTLPCRSLASWNLQISSKPHTQTCLHLRQWTCRWSGNNNNIILFLLKYYQRFHRPWPLQRNLFLLNIHVHFIALII